VKRSTDLISMPTRDEDRTSARWHSLGWRHPATISLFVVLILAIVVWASFREVEGTLVRGTGERAQGASTQIASTMETVMRPGQAQLRQVAAEPALREFLKEATPANRAAAELVMRRLAPNGPRRITLWDQHSAPAIDFYVPARAGDSMPLPVGQPPTTEGLLPLRRGGQGAIIESSAGVSDSFPALTRLGYLTAQSPMVINPPDLFDRLVGADASVMFGNADGSLWFSPSKRVVVSGPSIDLTSPGVAVDQSRGEDRLGALMPIRDTPWTVWVDFPEALVTAPARDFLRRMIVLGLILSVGGAVVVRLLTLRVTRPLAEMTAATEAIEAGDYTRRLDDGRLDEFGRLARSFDAMTMHVAHDLAHRERVARTLQENDDRLRDTLSAARVGTWQMTPGSETTQWSETMAPLFGLAKEHLPSTRSEVLALIHQDDHEAVKHCLDRAPGDRREHETYFRALQPTGEVKWLLGRSRVREDAAGVTQIFGVCFDVSEQRRLEDQLRQSQKMDAIGKLAGGVAHDFNNLLTAILGFGNFVLDSMSLDDPRRIQVQEILKAGQRAASLTAQLLAFSRQQMVQPVVVDVNAVVTETNEMLRRLIGENIQLEARLSPDVVPVRADPVQLQQVIMNLAINARDAMPDGGRLTIETANAELDAASRSEHFEVVPGRYALLAVTDTGVGLSAEVRARMFEPFFTTKGRGQGTGLGLATVYGAVKQAGGYIWAYGEPGRGSSFKVYLPAAMPVAGAAAVAAPPAAAVRGSETVLLVEDEEAVRLLAGMILTRGGYTVIEASSAREATEKYLAHGGNISVLVTDVVLPMSSGPELFKDLSLKDPRLKVLYMSGYTDDAVFRTGRLRPGEAFIQKPFTSESLRGKVREILDHVGAGQLNTPS
jgi:PAS domain S-box-containing protein